LAYHDSQISRGLLRARHRSENDRGKVTVEKDHIAAILEPGNKPQKQEKKGAVEFYTSEFMGLADGAGDIRPWITGHALIGDEPAELVETKLLSFFMTTGSGAMHSPSLVVAGACLHESAVDLRT
jgi:hypothetical protein